MTKEMSEKLEAKVKVLRQEIADAIVRGCYVPAKLIDQLQKADKRRKPADLLWLETITNKKELIEAYEESYEEDS